MKIFVIAVLAGVSLISSVCKADQFTIPHSNEYIACDSGSPEHIVGETREEFSKKYVIYIKQNLQLIQICHIKVDAKYAAKRLIAKCGYETKLAGKPQLMNACVKNNM